MDDALGVVALKGEGAGGDFTSWHVGVIDVLRLGIVDQSLVVDLDEDVFALDFDVVVEPVIVFDEDFFDGVFPDILDRI